MMMPMGGSGVRRTGGGGGMTIAKAKWLMEHPAEAEALENAHKRRMDAYARGSADHQQRKAEADQRHADADIRDRQQEEKDKQQHQRELEQNKRDAGLMEWHRKLEQQQAEAERVTQTAKVTNQDDARALAEAHRSAADAEARHVAASASEGAVAT